MAADGLAKPKPRPTKDLGRNQWTVAKVGGKAGSKGEEALDLC